MPYTKTDWVAGVTPLSEANLDKLETQYDEAKADFGSFLVASVEISSAEILALFTTAKTLVAAPGAGKILDFISLLLAYDKGAVEYTVAGVTNFQVKYVNKSGTVASATGNANTLLAQPVDALLIMEKLGTPAGYVAGLVNVPLVLSLAGANPGAGNGTIHAKVCYIVHTTGL